MAAEINLKMTEDERRRAARISYLIQNTFPKILQHLSVKGLSPKQLHQCYKNNPNEMVKRLRLRDDEKDILSDLSTEQSYQKCDSTLLYKLIRNFNLVPKPINGWGKVVFVVQNTGDAVERLRRIRNSIIHRPNAKYGQRKEERVFVEVLEIARLVDAELGITTETFEDEVLLHQSWDPEMHIRDKYIIALEKIMELEELGHVLVNDCDIAIFMAKDVISDSESLETADEQIPLTIYVRSKNLNKDAVIVRLDDMKDKINKNRYKIIYKYAETGSVIIHVLADASYLQTKDAMVSEMKDFVKKMFSTLDKKCIKEQNAYDAMTKKDVIIECVFASSDIIEEEEELADDEYDDSWLRMKVTVGKAMYETPKSLKDNLGGFIGDVLHTTKDLISTEEQMEVHIRPDTLNKEEEERKRKIEEEERKRKIEEEERKRKIEEEERKRKIEEEERKRKIDEDERKRKIEENERKRKREEDERKRKIEENERKRKREEEEERIRHKEYEDGKRRREKENRKRARDEELNEDVKYWKKIRNETLPRLNNLKRELYTANDKIKTARGIRNVTAGFSVFVGLVCAPFTGGASLLGAAAVTTGAAGITFLIESSIEKSVLETTQEGVYKDKTETIQLRQRVKAFKGTESSPFAEELFAVDLETIIGLGKHPLLSFIVSWIGIESAPLLNAIAQLEKYIQSLKQELQKVEQVQGKHLFT